MYYNPKNNLLNLTDFGKYLFFNWRKELPLNQVTTKLLVTKLATFHPVISARRLNIH